MINSMETQEKFNIEFTKDEIYQLLRMVFDSNDFHLGIKEKHPDKPWKWKPYQHENSQMIDKLFPFIETK